MYLYVTAEKAVKVSGQSQTVTSLSCRAVVATKEEVCMLLLPVGTQLVIPVLWNPE